MNIIEDDEFFSAVGQDWHTDCFRYDFFFITRLLSLKCATVMKSYRMLNETGAF